MGSSSAKGGWDLWENARLRDRSYLLASICDIVSIYLYIYICVCLYLLLLILLLLFLLCIYISLSISLRLSQTLSLSPSPLYSHYIISKWNCHFWGLNPYVMIPSHGCLRVLKAWMIAKPGSKGPWWVIKAKSGLGPLYLSSFGTHTHGHWKLFMNNVRKHVSRLCMNIGANTHGNQTLEMNINIKQGETHVYRIHAARNKKHTHTRNFKCMYIYIYLNFAWL